MVNNKSDYRTTAAALNLDVVINASVQTTVPEISRLVDLFDSLHFVLLDGDRVRKCLAGCQLCKFFDIDLTLLHRKHVQPKSMHIFLSPSLFLEGLCIL